LIPYSRLLSIDFQAGFDMVCTCRVMEALMYSYDIVFKFTHYRENGHSLEDLPTEKVALKFKPP
jgi:hypothetical protein